MIGINHIMGIEGVTNWESFNYLGVPIFKSKPKTMDWNPMIEKIRKKILAWGVVWLNLAGKMVLIKYVVNSYPLYQCSMMLASNGILTKIEGLLRAFLWQCGNNNDCKKFALISWKKIKLPWMEGGL